MTLREKAQLAERAARASGEMLEKHDPFKIKRKSENDFVTEMDYKSEALIRETLLAACPEDAFFGEETGGATEAEGRWVVDPIDGTTNFMRGHRLYAISIAYEHHGVLTIGCVYCPGTDELFLGVRGQGATLNGKPIHVTHNPLEKALTAIGTSPYYAELANATCYVIHEFLTKGGDIIRSQTYSVYLPYLTVAAVYLILVMTFTGLLGRLERYLRNTGADPVHNDS